MPARLDCHLIFPPPWSLFHSVHLSLPLLAGHLARAGRTVATTDLNVRVANRLLRPAALGAEARTLAARLDGRAALAPSERERLEEALALAPLAAPLLPWATRVLRGADRIEEVGAGAQVLRLAAEAVSARCHPGRWIAVDGEYRPAELATAERFTLPEALAALARDRLDPVEQACRAELDAAIAARPARLYGVGCAGSDQVYLALRVARWLKERDPAARVVLGGAAIPFIRGALHAFPAVFDVIDFAVIGDGEEPLRLLLDALDGGIPLSEVPSLHRRGPDGSVLAPLRTWNAGLAPPAPPRFRDAELASYFTPPTLPFLSARRCYWNRCTFCSITYDKSTPFGPQPAAALVEQLAGAVEETGCRTFTFVDEAVPGPQLRRIAEALLARGLALDGWDALVRFEPKLDRATLDLAYRAGMRAIYFGLESGSPSVVARMDKGFDIAVAERNLADCHAAGIWTHCFVMVGFPGETEIELEESIEFLRRNAAHIDSVAAGTFDASIGSPVADDPARFGLEVGALPPGSLEYRLPQPGRAALLDERLERVRKAIAALPMSWLHMGAVNEGNTLRDLARRRGKEGLRERQLAQIARRQAARELAGRGPGAWVGLARTALASAPPGSGPDGAALLLDREGGVSAIVPRGVVDLARRGAPLARLDALGARLGAPPGLAYALADQGLFEAAAVAPAGAAAVRTR